MFGSRFLGLAAREFVRLWKALFYCMRPYVSFGSAQSWDFVLCGSWAMLCAAVAAAATYLTECSSHRKVLFGDPEIAIRKKKNALNSLAHFSILIYLSCSGTGTVMRAVKVLWNLRRVRHNIIPYDRPLNWNEEREWDCNSRLHM